MFITNLVVVDLIIFNFHKFEINKNVFYIFCDRFTVMINVCFEFRDPFTLMNIHKTGLVS